MDANDYMFPTFHTEYGGLVREENGKFFFVEVPPQFHIFTPGDLVPAEWRIVGPANEAARRAFDADWEIDAAFAEFTDLLIQFRREGKMTDEEARSFFPAHLRA